MGADEEHGSAPDERLKPAEHGKSQSRLFRRPRPRNEWVGGFIPFPWEAADYLDPPRVAIWLELPEGVVVGTGVESTEGDALVDALREALAEPLAGPPRRPDALRVADDRMANAVRFALSGEIPVVTGATPEIEDFEQRLRKDLEELGDHAPSHFDGGVSAESFERLFGTASELFNAEPWSIVDDIEVLEVDIPSLDVEGACVSICGASSDIRGLMVFPSYDEFDRHYDAALDFDERGPNTGMFVEMLLVGFHPEADVPPSMLAEVREHGWPLAGTEVYPLVSCLDEEGFPRETTERDVAVISATAHAIAELFNRHWDLFESQGLPRFARSFRDETGHRVKVTVPHPVLNVELEDEPFDDFSPSTPAPEPFRPRAARNAPCPCGSGRKYKKCHLRPDEEEHAEGARAIAMHLLDNALIRRWEGIVEKASSAPDLGEGGSPADRWPDGLRNLDDDSLLFTVDHFDIEAGETAEVRRRVGALEGARTDRSEDAPSWAILRPDDPARLSGRATLIGRIEVDDGVVRAETNSVNRADALRERIEAACGPLVRHRIREHSDPLALARGTDLGPPEDPSPEEAGLVASLKAKHYADWVDHPLPALGDRTPRACMETAAGRADVDRLLKDMEYREELAPGPSFDFSIMRRDLGLEAD